MIDLEDIKSRINPAYADTIGTESYERRMLVEEIESLRQRVEELKQAQSVCGICARNIDEASGIVPDILVQNAALMGENMILSQRVAEVESTWLSPETYETLMQERHETLQQLAASQHYAQQLEQEIERLKNDKHS
jgi:prefoldin subunit 5